MSEVLNYAGLKRYDENIKNYIDDSIAAVNHTKQINSDWNQNDVDAVDYIKGRTHFIDVSNVFKLDISDAILSEHADVAEYAAEGCEFWNPHILLKAAITYGDGYRYVDYVFKKLNNEYQFIGYHHIYHDTVIHAKYDSDSCTLFIKVSGSSGDITNKTLESVELYVDELYYFKIAKLDEMYIPESIARQSEIERLENRIAELENIINQITIKVE